MQNVGLTTQEQNSPS